MSKECTTLGPFPLEIWILVCEKLADRLSQDPLLHYARQGPSSDLKALCRVSKAISPEAERALFRCYDIRRMWPDPWTGMLNDYEIGFKRHHRFLRTVLDRPHLLSHVQELSLNGPFIAYWPRPVEAYERLATRLGLDHRAFPLYASSGPHFTHSTVGDTLAEHAVRLAVLLLLVIPLLPNLKSLAIAADGPTSVATCLDAFWRMREDGAIKTPDTVVDLRLGWDGDMRAGDLFTFGSVLAWNPNVQRLHLRRCHGMQPHGSSPQFVRQAGAAGFPRDIEALELHACLFDAATVRLLLRSCPRLERFVYHSGGGQVLYHVADPMDHANLRATPRQILGALQGAKETLKEIDLDFTTEALAQLVLTEEPLTADDFDVDAFPVLKRARVAHGHGRVTFCIIIVGDDTADLGKGACCEKRPHRLGDSAPPSPPGLVPS